MRRRLLNMLTAMSLLICVVSTATWQSFGPRSNHWWVCGQEPNYTLIFPSIGGELVVSVNRPYAAAGPSEIEFSKIQFPGFGYRHAGGGAWGRTQYWHFAISYWLLVPATAVLPGAWVARRWRRRRTAGRCRRCAYDLTGNVSGVCPECGVPAAGKAECNG